MVGVCWASVVPYTLVSYLGGWKHVQKVFGEEEKEFMNKFLWFLETLEIIGKSKITLVRIVLFCWVFMWLWLKDDWKGEVNLVNLLSALSWNVFVEREKEEYWLKIVDVQRVIIWFMMIGELAIVLLRFNLVFSLVTNHIWN